jgi:hypothetical protein
MLTELRISMQGSFYFTVATLARLTRRTSADAQTPCLIPKLEILKFRLPHLAKLDDVFVDMIESRWKICAEDMATAGDKVVQIKSLGIYPKLGIIMDSRALARLYALVDEGLELNYEDEEWASVFGR